MSMDNWEEHTYWCKVYVTGPKDLIAQCLREFVVETPCCITMEEIKYFSPFTEETGVVLGLINYPKYPWTDEETWNHAVDLGQFVVDQLHQGSYTVMDPTTSVTFDKRQIHYGPKVEQGS